MKMKNKRTLLVAFAALAVLGGATSLASLQDQNPSEDRLKEPPTVVVPGKMTERQRQHSKLFKHSGRKLLDIAAIQATDVTVEEETGDPIHLPGQVRSMPVFQSALCNADAVIIGSLVNKSAHVTEEENFVFTDYEVGVEEIIKNNPASPTQVNSTITTARDGGSIQIGSRILRANRQDFTPPVVGRRYVMFLRFIPSTGAYLMYGNGTFELRPDAVFALGQGSRDELLKQPSSDPHNFVQMVRGFAGENCRLDALSTPS